MDDSSRIESDADLSGALAMEEPNESDSNLRNLDRFRDEQFDSENEMERTGIDFNNTTIDSTQNNVDTKEFDRIRDEFIERELEQMEEEEEKVDSEEDMPEHKEGDHVPVSRAKPTPASPNIAKRPTVQTGFDLKKESSDGTARIQTGIAGIHAVDEAVTNPPSGATSSVSTKPSDTTTNDCASKAAEGAKTATAAAPEKKKPWKMPWQKSKPKDEPLVEKAVATDKSVSDKPVAVQPTVQAAATQPDVGAGAGGNAGDQSSVVGVPGSTENLPSTEITSTEATAQRSKAASAVASPIIATSAQPVNLTAKPVAGAAETATGKPQQEQVGSAAGNGAATQQQPSSSSVTAEELEEVKRDMEELHRAGGAFATAGGADKANVTAPSSSQSVHTAAATATTIIAATAPVPTTAPAAAAAQLDATGVQQEPPTSEQLAPNSGSSRFRRNREAAESSGNKGGGLIPTAMAPGELALKLQSSWRGKRDRRKLKLKMISACTIQRVFRGLFVRHRSSAQLNRHRENIAAEQTRKTRLAHIRSKEKDLALLSTIPAEQYMGFERLRRENGAKTIQRNWRTVQLHRQYERMARAEAEFDDWLGDDMLLGSKAASCFDTRRFPQGYQTKPGKPTGTQNSGSSHNNSRIPGASSSMLNSKKVSDEQVLREQSAKLKEHMVNVIQGAISDHKRDELFAKLKAQQNETPRTQQHPTPGTTGTAGTSATTPGGVSDPSAWKKYEIEIEALSLAQLQRRIRESAHSRTRKQDMRANKSGFRTAGSGGLADRATDVSSSFDATGRGGRAEVNSGNTGSGGAPRWGARRNYQDLMEAQMHANILLQEHQYAQPHIMQRQEARHKVLGNCQHLLQQLQNPLSLDQAKAFIKAKQQATAQAGAPLKKPNDNKGSAEATTRSSSTATSDPQAEAWLVDEELWNIGTPPSAPVAPTRPGDAPLYVQPSAIQAATEQHVQALYALRTSSITHDNGKQPAAERATIAGGRAKHWGAVALPLPLHVVSNATAEATGNSLRGSGEWKGLRGSFNRSFDADSKNDNNSGSGAGAGEKSAVKGAAGLTPGSLSQRLLTDAKLFKPLASQWAKGSDVEDSLYWIAYATQPSNIVPGAITPSPFNTAGDDGAGKSSTKTGADAETSAAGGAQTAQQAAQSSAHAENKERAQRENEELRRRVAVEAMALSQRVPRVMKQVRHEEERIARLAEVYQAEMFAYLRREHALSAQQLLGGERVQQQHIAACRIQAAVRGRSARIYATGVRAQRRVYMALQNLLNEISCTEGVSAPALPAPTLGYGGYGGYSGQGQGQGQGHSRQRQASGMLGALLSSLPDAAAGHHPPPPRQYASKGAVGSGHSAASATRTSTSTLAGLNIGSASAGGQSQTHNRMGATQISGLTTTPHQGGSKHGNSVNMSALSVTPQTNNISNGRVGYAEGLVPQYPLQAVAPPTNRQYSAAHSDTKNLVSNVHAMHVHAPNSTPSYFSPMVSGMDDVPPSTRGIGAHHGDYSARSDYSGDMMGIASQTPAGGSSVVNRGAWHGGTPGKRTSSNENGPGATVASLGISSPSKQTFKLLNTSFTAADQVPNESLHLSHSYNSDQLDANAEAAPKLPGSRGGAFKRSGANSAQQQQQQQVDSKPGGGGDGGMAAFSPRPGVTFSLELNLPDSKDHSFPTGNQLQRSEEYPGGGATPQRGAGEVIHTPSSVGSHALSEFSFVHEEDARPGAAYISSPGHSRSHGDGGSDGDHSLSRSLSASFGQVSSDKFTDDYHHSGGRREEKALSPVAESPASGRRSSRYPDDYSSVQGSSARSGGGALNPSMLAQYAKQMQNPLDEDSEDSVEGLELSYGGGDAAVGSVKGFRIHGTVQAAQRAERAAVVVGQAMAAVEQRFRTGTCSVSGFIASALAADVRNFDKTAALRLLQSMAMVTGVMPLVKWLQRFRYDPQQAQMNDPDYVPPAAGKASPSTSLVLGVGEIQVHDCALLIAELSAELRIMDTSAGTQKGGKSEEEREKEMLFNLIQSCVLMKLLGAANDSGRLRISEVYALFEDAWVRSVPNNGVRVSLLLAQLRFSLLQQATRKAGHPRKLFDDIVTASRVTVAPRTHKASSVLEQWYQEDCVSSAAVGVIFEHIFATSASFSAYSANKALCLELAQALVKFNAWSDHEDYISIPDLRNAVCNLCSFRILQKRLQVWFRAVPSMHPSLLKHIGAQLNADAQSHGMVSVSAFCRCADLSCVPLSQSECFMLAQLLTRRRNPTAGAGGDTSTFVDVALLQRIKSGDFLHAALV